MVREIKKDGEKVFICKERGLGCSTKELAKRCEEYCSKYRARSIEIARNAVYPPQA